MQEIIIQIKQELKKRSLTYKEFAKMANMPESTLKNIFAGAVPNPRIDTIELMLKSLDLNKYERKPQGVFLTHLEEEIVNKLITCSEHQQHLVQAYIEGLKSKGNIANQKNEPNKNQNKNLG